MMRCCLYKKKQLLRCAYFLHHALLSIPRPGIKPHQIMVDTGRERLPIGPRDRWNSGAKHF